MLEVVKFNNLIRTKLYYFGPLIISYDDMQHKIKLVIKGGRFPYYKPTVDKKTRGVSVMQKPWSGTLLLTCMITCPDSRPGQKG